MPAARPDHGQFPLGNQSPEVLRGGGLADAEDVRGGPLGEVELPLGIGERSGGGQQLPGRGCVIFCGLLRQRDRVPPSLPPDLLPHPHEVGPARLEVGGPDRLQPPGAAPPEPVLDLEGSHGRPRTEPVERPGELQERIVAVPHPRGHAAEDRLPGVFRDLVGLV